jgi:hypothetical protein
MLMLMLFFHLVRDLVRGLVQPRRLAASAQIPNWIPILSYNKLNLKFIAH